MDNVCVTSGSLGRTVVQKHVPTTVWIAASVKMESVSALRATLVRTALC